MMTESNHVNAMLAKQSRNMCPKGVVYMKASIKRLRASCHRVVELTHPSAPTVALSYHILSHFEPTE